MKNSAKIAFYSFIKNALLPQPEPAEPTPPTEEEFSNYKASRKEEMSRRSLERIGQIIPSYQVINAQLSLRAIEMSEDPIYSFEKANNILASAHRIGKACRDEYYRLATAIDLCETIEQIDEVVDNAQFDNIKLD